MELQNEPETPVVIVEPDNVEIVATDLAGVEAGEIEDENGGESDAVAIARIEADAAVTIAAVAADAETARVEANAEVEVARIEAESERVRSWEDEAAEIRDRIADLSQQVTNLLSAVANPSTPTPQPEPEPLEVAAELAEEVTENSTQEFTLAPTSETVTEVTLESEGGKPEAVAEVRTVRRRRLI